MRIHLKTNETNQIVPFDHQHFLVGTIHKWLGLNNEHGNISLYSFSRLNNGKRAESGLSFNRGASFFFSSYDNDLIRNMIKGIQLDNSMFSGLYVTDIIIEEDPDFSGRDLFFTASPIFLKRKLGEKIKHVMYYDENANSYLKESLETKLKLAGIEDKTLEVRFDVSAPGIGTKKVNYRGIQNRASWCPVIIIGKPETKLFAWNVGLGNSTGIGFGAIK